MTPTVRRLHHFAYRCRDSEETRAFYEDILGMKLALFLRLPYYEQPGDYPPFTHLFFEMDDGSYVAFFDLGDDGVSNYCEETPDWVNHLALEVGSPDELETFKARLENGIRLELTARVKGDDWLAEEGANAHAQLRAWTEEKRAKRTAAE